MLLQVKELQIRRKVISFSLKSLRDFKFVLSGWKPGCNADCFVLLDGFESHCGCCSAGYSRSWWH